MKNEEKMKQEIKDMRSKNFREIEAILRRFDYNSQDMIACFVASLCDVDVADMLSVTHNELISKARWLYWYALRYFTREPLERISERSKLDGHSFQASGIGICVNKMARLIDSDDVWKRRWLVTKRMMRLLQDPLDYIQNDFSYNSQKYKVFLQVPKGTKENVEIQVVEK